MNMRALWLSELELLRGYIETQNIASNDELIVALDALAFRSALGEELV